MDPASDRRLGRAALIVTALLILTLAVTASLALRPRGDIEIPAEWRSPSGDTLIIFGREGCAACAASAAFHKDLAAAAQARGIRVVAASTSSVEEKDAFAASIGVSPEHAVRAIPPPKNLKSVPAIVLVTRDGKILRKIEGALSVEQQAELFSFVSTIR